MHRGLGVMHGAEGGGTGKGKAMHRGAGVMHRAEGGCWGRGRGCLIWKEGTGGDKRGGEGKIDLDV